MTSASPQKPCQHQRYCYHQLYEKCRDERVRNIAELFPLRHVETSTNATMKFANPQKSNIPTIAYEKYILQELDIERDENFVKDFYVNSTAQLKEDLNIVDLTEKQLASNNAYVLCEVERTDFQERQRQRIGTINKARNKAIKHFNEHFENNKKEEAADKQENVQGQLIQEKYLKKLHTKLEEVAEHIIHGGGQARTDRQKEFLLSKDYLNGAYLAGVKVKKPKNALEILEEIRVLLQKHKLKHATEREQIEANKSMTQSFMTEASMTNTSQQSMLSEASGVENSQIAAQDAVITRYCNMVELQKKWNKKSIDEVKHVIRRAVMQKVLLEAQKKELKEKLKEKQINESLKRSNPELAKKLKQKEQKETRSKSTLKKKGSYQPESTLERKKTPVDDQPATALPKAELDIKEQWMKTGKFNPAGELFERTNNYTRLFAKKLQDAMFNLQVKDDSELQRTAAGNCNCRCKCPCEK